MAEHKVLGKMFFVIFFNCYSKVAVFNLKLYGLNLLNALQGMGMPKWYLWGL